MDLRSVSGLVLLAFGLMAVFGRELRPLGAILSLSLSGVAFAALYPDWWWVSALVTFVIWVAGCFVFAVATWDPVPWNEYVPCPEVFIFVWPFWICLVSLDNFVSQSKTKTSQT